MKKILLALLFALVSVPALASTTLSMPEVSFVDKLNQGFNANYGWYFGTQVLSASRAVAMGSSALARYPNSSVQFTVNTDDNSAFGNQRNEYLGMLGSSLLDETPGTTPIYYGMSIYFPSATFSNDGGVSTGGYAWEITGQFHGPDTGCYSQPNLAIITQCHNPDTNCGGFGATHMIFQVVGGDCVTPTVNLYDLGAYPTDQWIDIVLKIVWATDSTGTITTWTRTNKTGSLKQTKLDGTTAMPVITQANFYMSSGVPVTKMYAKQGLYEEHQLAHTNIIYEGPLVRASTFHDAALAAFGTYP